MEFIWLGIGIAVSGYFIGDVAKAQQLAKCAVEKLHKMPYSSYFQFAREVLSDVSGR